MGIKNIALFWLGLGFLAAAALMFFSIWKHPQWVVKESRWMPWFMGAVGLLSHIISFLIAG